MTRRFRDRHCTFIDVDSGGGGGFGGLTRWSGAGGAVVGGGARRCRCGDDGGSFPQEGHFQNLLQAFYDVDHLGPRFGLLHEALDGKGGKFHGCFGGVPKL